MEKEKLTYQILEQRFKKQKQLIAEGKMQKPKLISRPFTPEEQAEFDLGITWEHVFGNNKKKK